jgi:hypothetical protein
MVDNARSQAWLERFQAKACPALDAGWKPVRVKKTRQIKNLEPTPYDFARVDHGPIELSRIMIYPRGA